MSTTPHPIVKGSYPLVGLKSCFASNIEVDSPWKTNKFILGVAFSGHSKILSVTLLCAAVGANGFIYSGEMAAMIGKFYVDEKGCVI